MQKQEDAAPDLVEFERLKDHFEPILRAAASQSSHGSSSSALHSISHHTHTYKSSITAAASAALNREITGVSKFTPSRSLRGARDKGPTVLDEVPRYEALQTCANEKGTGGGDWDLEQMRGIENIAEVATLEHRWSNSWAMSFQTKLVFCFISVIDP